MKLNCLCAILVSFFLHSKIEAQNISIINHLPESVSENSGLIYVSGKLYTHNDSGHKATLFEIDEKTSKVLRKIKITNANNRDWEDLAQDNNYIYIGDIGNGGGYNTKFTIYKIPKKDLAKETVAAEKIIYTYPNNKDSTTSFTKNMDAEALVSYKNNLLVFTKHWSGKTHVFSIPKIVGNYTATHKATFNVNGLITGGDYSQKSKKIYLCGYSSLLVPFMVEVTINSENFKKANVLQKNLQEISPSQVEAIAHKNNNTFFLSSEKLHRIILLKPTLFQLTLEE